MNTYKEYLEHVNNMKKQDKNYLCSEEYFKIYLIMIKLYKTEGYAEKRSNKMKLNRKINKLNKDHGIGMLFC